MQKVHPIANPRFKTGRPLALCFESSFQPIFSLMCREQLEEMEEGEEILEFQLAERFTFLEYIPSEKILRKCPSAPELARPDASGCVSVPESDLTKLDDNCCNSFSYILYSVLGGSCLGNLSIVIEYQVSTSGPSA